MFETLDFETIGSCNRTCRTCIRNSHPDRDAVESWFGQNLLEEDLIYEAVEQALAMGFRGRVVLSHYNEPLMDERLPRIAHRVRSYPFEAVYLNTNADFITPELADELDGALDYANVTLYMNGRVGAKRAKWIPTLFQETEARIIMIDRRPHHATHFTPAFDLQAKIKVAQGKPCHPRKVIINHRRQYLLCCDDLIGNFDLGTFPEISIRDHWLGKRKGINKTLSRPGGRSNYSYCTTCPVGG